MNKTININLGGVFFHIDEDAYKILKNYLDAIRRSLSDDAQGKNEIINDIEFRIGEILSERIKDIRQVINQQDIEEIIVIMGKPEEYSGDDEFFEDESYTGNTKSKRGRKLYRNSEDKFLGGVSSGLAHYFGMDVIWVRLAWLVLLISGFSVILYPILWILLPEANTTSEKLEMEGEPVNISNIERKIREELTDASKRVKEGFDDVSETIKKGDYQSKVKTGLQDILDLLAKVFTAIFKVTGKFIGILLIVISVLTLISMFIGGFSLGSAEFLGLDDFTNYPPFFYTSKIPIWFLTSLVFIVVAIPFVLLFKLGLKIISSSVSSFSRATNLSLLGVWLIAIMGIGFSAVEYGAQFSNKYTISKEHIITKPIAENLNIKMIEKESFGIGNSSNDKSVFIDGVETSYRTDISLDIRESNTDEMYLKIIKKANAITVEDAKRYTDEMEYNYKVNGNNLLLNGYFLSDMNHIYTSQYIKIILYIPQGKTVYLDKSTKYYLNNVDNIQDIYDPRMIRHHFKMTKDGLDCLDCGDNDSKKSKSVSISVDVNTTTKNSDSEKENDYSKDDAAEVHEKIKEDLNNKGVEI